MSKILIACGGTGGHLAPGIAVGGILQERGNECVLLISEKQVDSKLVEKYPHLTFKRVPGSAFAGGFSALIRSLVGAVSGFFFAQNLIRDNRPDLVFLFGGFVSVGLGLAARFSGVPVVLHEANQKPGRTIRLLKRFAMRVYLPEGLRLKGVPPGRVRYFGYPVRQDMKHSLKVDARRRLGLEVPHKLLVILGGSQGASALNDWVIHSFEELAKSGISIYCVSGIGKIAAGTVKEEGLRGETVTATFVPFTDRMGDVISAADLVVTRAGAGAIAEVIRCRAPAILVPYPHAADNHQYENALMHERHGAGILLDEQALDGLAAEVRELIFNDWMLAKLKSNLDRLDSFDSAERIATDIEGLCAARALTHQKTMEANA